jgi:signal transduction histidine kinase
MMGDVAKQRTVEHAPPRPPAPSAADHSRSESVWVRTIVGWHIAFWLMLAVVAASLLTADGVTARQVLGSLAALGAVGLAYAWLTRTPGHERVRRNGYVYLTVLCAAVLTLLALNPGVAFFLFLAYPQVWFLADRLVDGIAWSVVLSTCALAGFGLRFGFSAEVMQDIAPDMAVSLAVSLVLGIWISRVIDQSEQRADLIAELERTRTELGQAQHAAGVVAERERMARDIHDTLAQGFTSVIALAQAERARLAAGGDDAPRLALLEETARENLGEARALVAAFAPVDLQGSGLVDALRRLSDRFTAETGVPVRLELPPGPSDGELGTAEAVVLLRVAQEALSNVRRHAGAAQVTLRLRRQGDGTGVEVADDGAGFDVDAVAGSSFGLSGMRSRVEEVGGLLAVSSRPGGGTRVTVSLP